MNAYDVVTGIANLACRMTGHEYKSYPTKAGGSMLEKGSEDWYVSVQNSDDTTRDLSRNTKAAQELNLVKTLFVGRKEKEGLTLHILEWDAALDFGGDFRVIYSAPMDSIQAHMHMAKYMASLIEKIPR